MSHPILKQLHYVKLILMNLFSKNSLPRTLEPSALTDQAEHVDEYNKAIDTIMVLPYVLVLNMILKLSDTTTTSLNKKSAVDLCCGPGHFTRLLATYGDCNQVTGVDLSEPMLRMARENAAKKNFGDKLQYINSDVTNLTSIESKSMDIVSFMDGAHHMNTITDVQKILREAVRVVKSDGLIILLDPVRPKTRATADLYERISGQSYVDLGLVHFAKDFHDSIHASWKASELFSAIPKDTSRTWIQLIPFGFPAFQIIIGLPEGKENFSQGKGLSKEEIADLIPKQYKADWDMLNLSFKLATKNKVPAAK